MAETRIPVDVFNPGQVFACLGLVEAADILLGDAAGAFHWQNATRAEFILRAAGENDPLHAVLAFLKEAEVLACVPEGSPHGRKRPKARSDGQPMEFEIVPSGHPFPSPDEGADRLPAILRAPFGGRAHDICISYWAEPTALTGRDNVKFWAGAGGYPGVALLKDALNLMHEGDRWQAAADDPLISRLHRAAASVSTGGATTYLWIRAFRSTVTATSSPSAIRWWRSLPPSASPMPARFRRRGWRAGRSTPTASSGARMPPPSTRLRSCAPRWAVPRCPFQCASSACSWTGRDRKDRPAASRTSSRRPES